MYESTFTNVGTVEDAGPYNILRHCEGSDGSAAGGRRSDLSEWQRSTDEDVALSTTNMSGTATGIKGARGNLLQYASFRVKRSGIEESSHRIFAYLY